MLLDIYLAYAPTEESMQAELEVVFQQVVNMFVGVCKSQCADCADDTEIQLQDDVNPHIWDVVKKYIDRFEAATQLTIFESKVMTIVKRDSILLSRPQGDIKI